MANYGDLGLNRHRPVMYVCPFCGANMSVAFSGAIISRVCDRCRADNNMGPRCPSCGK